MSKQMSLSDAITEIHNACEYYDMVHDTGDEEETKKIKIICGKVMILLLTYYIERDW